MKRLRSVFARFLLLVSLASPAAAFAISQVVVFGDSNVDNGNLRALFGPQVNPPPNFEGRNSNGIVVVEYVANLLGVPLKDYAYSGATTGPQTAFFNIPHALAQIQTYLGQGPVDPNALFIYWAGSNDILLASTPPEQLANKISIATGNIQTALSALNSAGARNVFVATRTPRVDLASTDNLNGVALNSAIKSLVQTLDPLLAADIRVFDAYASIVAMMNNPATYGFTQTTALCISNPLGDGCPTDLAVAKGYIQWDAAHKTTRVHELMAQEIVAQVPEPRTFVLLTAGLLALVWLRRRGRA